MPTNREAGGSSSAAAASNKLSAALKELQKFYVLMGRNDVGIIAGDLEGLSSSQFAAAQTANAAAEKLNSSQNIPQEAIEELMFTLIDNTEGAYFTKDMLTSTKLLSRFEYDGIEDYVQIVYESPDNFDHGIDAPFYIKDASRSIVSLSSLSGWASEDEEDNASIRDLITKSVIRSKEKKDDAGNVTKEKKEFPCKFTELNKNPRNPDKFDSPTLSAFMFPNQRLSLAMRGASAVSLFANSIPTIEMSRCTPYINIQFISAVPDELGKRTGQISMLRFLGMGGGQRVSLSNTGENIGLEDALPQNLKRKFGQELLSVNNKATFADPEEASTYSTALSAAGMELFTSPQTLVNADKHNLYAPNSSWETNNALNTFAPLMTLNSLKISISGLGNALHCNKTGTLSFTLHDRSRMTDIAPLISPSIFGHSYLQVEFGWSHPDGDDAFKNAYGALINSMRGSQQFNIQSSDFSIQNDGQVKIDMKIASRGASEIRMFPIVTGNLMPVGPFKHIMAAQLGKIIASLQGEDFIASRLSEIRNKIDISISAANSPSTVIPRDTWKEFMSFLRPGDNKTKKTTADLQALVERLVGVLDPGNQKLKGGEIANSSESFKSEVEFKLKQLQQTNDPFFLGPPHDSVASVMTGKYYVSLGKIIMSFLGAPLAATSKFDEVQVMFYRFNSQSGAARYHNSIANFLVDWDDIHNTITNYAKVSPRMSVSGLIGFLNSNIFAKPDDLNYGLKSLHKRLSEERESGEGEEDKSKLEDIQNNIKVINDEIDRALQLIYSQSSEGCTTEFRPPRLSVMFESLPAFVQDEGSGSFSIDPSKTILRVHIFDLKASSHESEMFIHNAMNDSEIASKFQTKSSTAYAETKEAKARLSGLKFLGMDDALETGKLEKVIAKNSEKSDYEVITSKVPNAELKRIIKQTVPSLTFGLGYTALNSFSLRSSTSGPVQQVLLLNSIEPSHTSPSDPPNKTSNFDDMTVYPASANMDMLGCPLLEYGQQFFVDLDTGTTADNIYRVTQIEHSLSAGEFRTNAILSFNSSGTIKNMRSMLKSAQLGLLKKADDEANAKK